MLCGALPTGSNAEWWIAVLSDREYSYECISQLRVHAGPTAPSQFVESFRFCDGLFGLDKVPVDLALSSRVVGAAHSSFMTKRIRRPTRKLTSLDMCLDMQWKVVTSRATSYGPLGQRNNPSGALMSGKGIG